MILRAQLTRIGDISLKFYILTEIATRHGVQTKVFT